MLKVIFQQDIDLIRFLVRKQKAAQTLCSDLILHTTDLDMLMSLADNEDFKDMLVIAGRHPHTTLSRLSRDVKAKNPNALFFIYSSRPEVETLADCIIPKDPDDKATLEALISLMLTDLGGKTLYDIKREFPQFIYP